MKNISKTSKESGFTLIELLVVILIIGILAAIAVPVFLNQRKKSAVAAVQSDLKNAALSMESEAVGNKGKFLSYVPNYNPRSSNVQVSLDQVSSSENKYCLKGKSEVYPDITYSYDSVAGGLLDKGQECIPVASGDTSFGQVLLEKKVLIVHARANADVNDYIAGAPTIEKYLKKYGFGTVDTMENPSPSVYKDYDVIIASGLAWPLPANVRNNLQIGYNNGAHIFTDGDDASPTNFSHFIASGEMRSSGVAGFEQTGATGLSPSFPYTFISSATANRNFYCAYTVQPGVVVVADGKDPSSDSEKRCITASAMSSGEGRWINLSLAILNGNTAMADASMNWLTS